MQPRSGSTLAHVSRPTAIDEWVAPPINLTRELHRPHQREHVYTKEMAVSQFIRPTTRAPLIALVRIEKPTLDGKPFIASLDQAADRLLIFFC